MESLDSVVPVFASYWWIGLIIVALFLGVRGNIPVWLGIALTGIVLLIFSPYALPSGIKSAIQTLVHAFMNVFR